MFSNAWPHTCLVIYNALIRIVYYTPLMVNVYNKCDAEFNLFVCCYFSSRCSIEVTIHSLSALKLTFGTDVIGENLRSGRISATHFHNGEMYFLNK